MGVWGTAIASNDTYADVYYSFFELYNDGLDVGEISSKLIRGNQAIINDVDDCNNFWFALAKAQWECKVLDGNLLTHVKDIIETENDLVVWARLQADPKDILKRKLVLQKFLAQISIERPKAKARKKKRIRLPVFQKGSCLTFKLSNGNYGGAIVLEAVSGEIGCNLIALTRINTKSFPNQSDFETAEIMVINYGKWTENASILWYNPVRHKKVSHLIENAGSVEVQPHYDINDYTLNLGYVADFDLWFIECADHQFKYEENNQPPIKKVTVNDWIVIK